MTGWENTDPDWPGPPGEPSDEDSEWATGGSPFYPEDDPADWEEEEDADD